MNTFLEKSLKTIVYSMNSRNVKFRFCKQTAVDTIQRVNTGSSGSGRGDHMIK